ncbi:MAG: hypothetical protein M1819_002164 [Sarea resinae]|nr:MAG: hypothetical protein M1819_002164 [Sarea resinae]
MSPSSKVSSGNAQRLREVVLPTSKRHPPHPFTRLDSADSDSRGSALTEDGEDVGHASNGANIAYGLGNVERHSTGAGIPPISPPQRTDLRPADAPPNYARNRSQNFGLTLGERPTEPVQSFQYPSRPQRPESLFETYNEEPLDTEYLGPPLPAAGLNPDKHPNGHCRSRRHIFKGRKSHLSVTILILAIYSAIGSGAYLFLALVKPRYGKHISTNGGLLPSTVSLLSTLIAKTIELSFVTVFEAFLGQTLCQRAVSKSSRGVTIADMSTRSWIQQPGSIMTNWESVKYAGRTFLGIIALVGSLVALLYTTASDALVSPKLSFGSWNSKEMVGLYNHSFSNPAYLSHICTIPLKEEDTTSCLQIEHASQAYHNFQNYLSDWDQRLSSDGRVDTALKGRPSGSGYKYNTSATANWIEVRDMEQGSEVNGRIVNNVTMAMPHVGVYWAAHDPKNAIMQPKDLQGLGAYSVIASVPSPAVNVLCANMSYDELKPIVYYEWPAVVVDLDVWPSQLPLASSTYWGNKTAVDDIFGFGEKYGRRAPVFPDYPKDYNTVLNRTGYQADSMFMLGKGSDRDDYVLCSMRAEITPACSTRYSIDANRDVIQAHCEDADDQLAFSRSYPDAPVGLTVRDWVDSASTWGDVIGVGIENSTTSRVLTQMIPTSYQLSDKQPSVAEALAVLLGCTLLFGSQGMPFQDYWSHPSTILEPGVYQKSNASIRSQEYASGGQVPWQGIFYVVLVLVFGTNCFCLGYFVLRGGLVTDFFEPQNLFALSINSPESRHLAGSCGGGPEKSDFSLYWRVGVSDGEHVFIGTGEESDNGQARSAGSSPHELEWEDSPIIKTFEQLSKRRRVL